MWAALIALPFFIYNWNIYGSLLAPYYLPQRIGSNTHFVEALLGNLISPARGLFVYSPFFILIGFVLVPRAIKRQMSDLEWLLLAIILLHWVMISSFPHWWGGHSYGPRFFADMLPFLMFLLIPLFRDWGTVYSPLLFGALLVLAAFAFFVNARGARVYAAGIEWNWAQGSVANVDDDPSRLWDWADPPFLRGLVPGKVMLSSAESIQLQALGQEVELAFAVDVRNPGHHAVAWQLETPQRVRLDQVAMDGANGRLQELPSFAEAHLPFIADLHGLPEGTHSLGGIRITPLAADGTAQANKAIILPVSVVIGGEETAVPELPALPLDILINGTTSTAADNQLYAIHGSGWYDRETLDPYAWRWASSPATILVYTPVKLDVLLQTTAVSLFTQEDSEATSFTITFNEETATNLPVTLNQPFTISGTLHKGWNRIQIESQTGNGRPSDQDPQNSDMRLLSFALNTIQFTTR